MSILKKVGPLDLRCYENLSQHYEAEFSPLTGRDPDQQGLYRITPLDEHHLGYLAWSKDGLPQGFVVIDISKSCYDIAEFYVIPTARRRGVGRLMAFATFDLYQGDWQVRQLLTADRAHAFWRSVVTEYTNGRFTEGKQADPEWGTMHIQKFSNAGLNRRGLPLGDVGNR